jgi:LuxR family transcriptional regulator of spore coat protein
MLTDDQARRFMGCAWHALRKYRLDAWVSRPDIVSMALLRAVKAKPHDPDVCSFYGWSRTLVRDAMSEYFRQEKKRLAGEVFDGQVSKELSQRALQSWRRMNGMLMAEERAKPILTDKQREVLQRLTFLTEAGDVARDLGIGKRTVESYLDGAYRRLGVNGKTLAVLEAARRGEITIPGLVPQRLGEIEG